MLKTIVSCRQGTSFRRAIGKPWAGEIILVTHSGWYLETEHKEILLLHDASFGEIPIGAALPDISLLLYNKQLEHQPMHYENNNLWLLPEMKIEVASGPESKRQEGKAVSGEWLETLRSVLGSKGKGTLRYTVCGIKPSEDDPFGRVVYQRVCELLAAINCGDPETISSAVKRLLGLGRGLTPGCDDWLLGYMYAAQKVGNTSSYRVIAETVLECAEEYTNSISAAYLNAAAHGEYYEVLERCLFNEGDGCIDRLLSVGSSSGSDMLSGMIAACT